MEQAGVAAVAGESRTAMVAAFVLQAFQERAAGEWGNFRYIVSQITPETNRSALKRWLRALTQSASLIRHGSVAAILAASERARIHTHACVSTYTPEGKTKEGEPGAASDEALVDAVLRLPWPLEDVQFGNSYMDFLENLLSANAAYAVPCLQMLVVNLTYRPEAPGAARQPASLSETELLSVYRRVHQMLYTVTRIVPSALSMLVNLIREHFPHRRQSTREHVVYMRNLFALLEYAPDLRADVLSTVVDRLLQIDLELQDADLALASGDDDGGGAPDEDDGEPLMFSVELDAEGDVADVDEGPPTTMAELRRSATRTANKLDLMLEIVLEYLEKTMLDAQRADQERLLRSLLQIFEEQLMPTYRSRYTQYVVFYFVCLRPDFPDALLALLVSILYDTSKNAIVRQSAAAYLASFVARCRNVNMNTTRLCIDRLRAWLDRYMDALEATVMVPDLHKYPLFYFPCQALLYIFCFRHEPLLAMRDGVEYVHRLDFPRLVNSRFNPLKICVPAIVDEFAALSKRHEILYCDLIISRNRDLILPHTHTDTNDEPTELEVFFMFEPCTLRRARRFIQPFYQEWTARNAADDDRVDMDGSQTDDTGDDVDDGSSKDASMLSGESLEHSLMFQLRNSPSSFRAQSSQDGSWG